VTTLSDPSAVNLLVAEIAERFADVGLAQIVDCLERAQLDLDGSVSAEGLPEMAARLAMVRLELLTKSAAD
jgi:hypothetical protein